MRKLCLNIFLIILILVSGCGVIKKKSEGAIVYDILFDDEEKDSNPVIGLLPTEMTLYFKDGSSKSMIEGFMGMFLSAYISDSEQKTNSFLFKVMADKHYCQTEYGEESLGFDKMPGLTLEETGEKKEIIGLTAKKVRVISTDSSIEPFDIYYTEDVDLEHPNWNNPFRSIGGVLLDVQLKMKGITMHLKAREIKYEEVPDEIFAIPEGFEKVSPDTLNAIVDKIMKSAQY